MISLGMVCGTMVVQGILCLEEAVEMEVETGLAREESKWLDGAHLVMFVYLAIGVRN